MSTDSIFEISSDGPEHTLAIAEKIGRKLRGYEVIELQADIGGGKTTFTRGLVRGFGYGGAVASPTFTLSCKYRNDSGQELHHFDFYRLQDAGVVGAELGESIEDKQAVVVIEWAAIVKGVLPEDKLQITITPTGPETRLMRIIAGPQHKHLLIGLA